MEIFKFFHRLRFFKIWLLALACLNESLNSQEDYPFYGSQGPIDGHWPATSSNTWDDDYSFKNAFNEDIIEDNFSAISQPCEDFSPPLPPPPKLIDEDECKNFVIFNPALTEAPNQEQHPLTEQGKAAAYHFHHEFSAEQVSEPSPPPTPPPPPPPIAPAPIEQPEEESQTFESQEKENHETPLPEESHENPNSKESERKETQEDEGQTAPLSQGKSNVQMIKKEENLEKEPPPPIENKDEVLEQKVLSLINRPSHESHISQAPLITPTPPRPPTVITPTSPGNDLPPTPAAAPPSQHKALKEISINFNNVAMIEYIRFISRISNKNFIFDDEDLQFNVTIVSEEPTTVENLMTALLQELKIRDLSLIEQGNNIIIHRNPRIRSPARIVSDGNEPISSQESELVTRVFRLNTLDPIKASEIIRPLLSEDALIEVLRDTNNLIVTDLVTTVNKVAQLIGTLDAPNSGVTIGQYVVRNAFVDSLVDLATKILQPIAQGNPFVLVPHPVSNSIFIVSNSFIVEKALAILQNLDLNEGRTKILSLETLQPAYPPTPAEGAAGPGRPGLLGPGGILPPPGGAGGPGGLPPGLAAPGGGMGPGGPLGPGRGFGPGGQFPTPSGIPESFPFEGPEGIPPPPMGGIGVEGRPSAIFDESRSFMPGGVGAASRWVRELPVGHIERTLFFIYKLRYRKGDNIEIALRKIAASLQLMGTTNQDLVATINSSQWIESSNAMIFTGTAHALEKVRELMLEVDVPLRQVFIEMLILDTTITDSLNYSVDWIDRFGGGTTTGEEGFLNPNPTVAEQAFLNRAEAIFPANSVVPPAPAIPLPVAAGFLSSGGFAAGVIGTHLTHNGTRFNTIGALVRAIHTDSKAEILLNPKIITEDNNPAEIFVGGTDRYKTQSITNDLGSLVTNNFQFIDVGTTLRVTPLIGNNGIITLEIVQETTDNAPGANDPLLANNQNVNLVQVLTKTRTVTKVHVPNGFFVVLSGMIQDRELRSYSRIPCLGGIPIIGAVGKTQSTSDDKRNLMLFIRPFIIDTDEDYEDVTRRQQDVYREKSKFRRSWNYEIDEALNFANIKPTDPDERDCSERNER